MDPKVRTVEEKLHSLGGAHGIVTTWEMLRAGITRQEIKGRVRKGVLVRVYRGVYGVGRRTSPESRYLAAVRACGADAVLSGRAAAWVWGLIKGSPPAPEVTAQTDRRVRGVKTRRSRRLDARDVTTHRGIPITTVPRTLLDLAASVSLAALALACHEAGVRYRTTPRQVREAMRRKTRAAGARKLRQVMEGNTRVALSKLERRFLKLLAENGLPLPITNRVAGSKRVDCRWPDHALTVELDSYQFHNSRHSWEQGYERERQAYARKDRFRRYTWHDVFEDPTRMLAELRELLV